MRGEPIERNIVIRQLQKPAVAMHAVYFDVISSDPVHIEIWRTPIIALALMGDASDKNYYDLEIWNACPDGLFADCTDDNNLLGFEYEGEQQAWDICLQMKINQQIKSNKKMYPEDVTLALKNEEVYKNIVWMTRR